MTADEIKTALDDRRTVALTVWGEARNQSLAGQAAVAAVIRNRLRTPRRYGRRYKAVCLQRLQFSCWWQAGGEANYRLVMDWAERLARREARAEFSCAPVLQLAELLMADLLVDPVAGATHYLTTELWRRDPPRWTVGLTPVAVIGDHVFFRGVA